MKIHPIWNSSSGGLLAMMMIHLALCPQVAWGWGTTGHEIIANLAWRQLSDEAMKWVQEVLAMNSTAPTADITVSSTRDQNADDDDDSNSPLGSIADWADRVRHFMPWSAPLHYIDIRDDLMTTSLGTGGRNGANVDDYGDGGSGSGCHISPHLNPFCNFVYDRDCVNNACVAGAILNYTQQLSSSSPPAAATTINKNHGNGTVHHHHHHHHHHDEGQPYLRGSSSLANPTAIRSIPAKKEALMFLTHFIGDIHQPLHCARTTDKGGNDFHVHFDVPSPNHDGDDRRLSVPTTKSRGLSYYYSQRDANSGGREREAKQQQQQQMLHPHGWNLHSVWDTGLIDVALERDYNQSRTLLEDDLWQDLQAVLHREEGPDSVATCHIGANPDCTVQWGQESWNMAIRFAYTLDDNSTDIASGATLDETYYETRWPLAKQRLVAGAIRLAATLEWIDFQQKQQVVLHDTKTTTKDEQPKKLRQKQDQEAASSPITESSSWLYGPSVNSSSSSSSYLDGWLSWNARMMVSVRANN